MANTLEARVDQRRLRFDDNLRVQELDQAGTILNETDWESLSGEKENEISFRFAAESRTSLTVKYAFNDRNQLTVQIVKQPGVTKASDVWTLPGRIVIDDASDVTYLLLDTDGNLTTRKIEVYAKLDFTQGNESLRVAFPDGTETVITGDDGKQSLSASAYNSGGDLARDLLTFTAVTRNTVDGSVEEMPAKVDFRGRWDLHENALVFVTKYDNSAGGPPVAYMALAGKIKGTNVGLIVEQDGEFALQINGSYAWNQNKLSWDLSLGNSKTGGIEARVGAEAKFVGKNGTLTLKGGATLKKGQQDLDLKFDLKIDYTTKGGHLIFKLEGDGKGYEVQLSGDFKIANGYVKFAITATDKDGKKEVKGTVEFGYYNKNSDLKMALEAVLGPNGITLKLNLKFQFFWGESGAVAQLP